MAWHYGTHSCGHEGRVQIYGPHKHREWKERWYFSQPCEECTEKQRQEENEENARKAREMELPVLQGVSEKQIAYGETCRMNTIERIEKFLEESEEEVEKYGEEAFERVNGFPWNETTAIVDRILQIRSAGWWIENSYSGIARLMWNIYDKLVMERKAEERLRAKGFEPNTAPEPPIRPEKVKTESIAEILIDCDALRIRFPEFREDFRKVVKEKLRMSWENGYWERKIGYRNGRIQDRAAEAALRLLAEGFIVRINDPEVREKAISGEYEPEHTRWIVALKDGRLGISWDREREDFYSVARRLPGSAWANPYVAVRPEHFEEVIDFADRYDFRITPAAIRSIDAAREEKDRALLVNVQKPEDHGRVIASTEPPKLDAPEDVGIDEELRDDD